MALEYVLSIIGGGSMIRGYFGLPGSGKTYTMTRDVQKEAKGRRVYANYHVEIPEAEEVIFLSNPRELVKVRDGILLIDEAGLWLPSFIWKRIPEQLIWQLAQVRKLGLDLYYTAQNPARVVKVLREITYESVFCFKFFRLFFQKVYGGIEDNFICWRIIPFTKKVASKYDTMERVGVITGGF